MGWARSLRVDRRGIAWARTTNVSVWSRAGAAVDIDLLAHYYQTWWFWIASSITAAISCFVGYRYRTESLRRKNADIKRHVAQRQEAEDALRRTEQSLHAIVKETSSVIGRDFFERLVQHLAKVLDVRYAFVAEVKPDQQDRVHTLAVWANDRIAPAFSYDLAGTPCEEVQSKGLCVHASGVQEQFPRDQLLRDLDVESYLGVIMRDPTGEACGILTVMDTKPLEDAPLTTSLLQLFSLRASAELGRERAEAALSQSEAQYRDFIATNLAGIRRFEMRHPMPTDIPIDRQIEWLMDELVLTECNDVFAQMYEQENAQALIGQGLRSLWGKNEQMARDVVRGFIEAGYKFDGVVATEELPSGKHRQFSNTARSVFEKGRIVRIWGTQIDVTQQMQAEKQLRESERRLRTLVENVPGVIFRCEARAPWRSQHVNDAIETLSGYSAQEYRSNKRNYYELIVEDDRSDVVATVDAAVENGTPYHIEYRIRRADGEIRWVREDGRPAYDDDTGSVCLDGVILDITENKRVEEERRQLSDHLRQSQKLQAMGTLAAGVAHDIRNMLTAVLGGLELAELNRHDEAALLKTLNDVRSAAGECTGMVQSLVTASRSEESPKSIINLADVVRRAKPLLRRILPASIEFQTDLPDQEVLIRGNASQIHQILMNLVVNAKEAMPEGGRITLCCELVPHCPSEPSPLEEPCARLIVSDTGTGMTPEVQKRALEPFFTTRSREQGTGLGLAVVHGIVQDHLGCMEIQSAVGEGTQVKISLPIGERDQESPIESHGCVESQEGNRETILVIEDNRRVRATMVESLEVHNYRVLQAADAEEGIRIYESFRDAVDLVVLDLDLPKMSGASFLQTVRKTTPDLAVLAVTGTDRREVDLPHDEEITFLSKPFSMTDLTQTVGSALRKKRIGV